jgi:Abnormal spindle-like microcephaly-assoc'd, ASPM-SPD-2-Hydin
MRCRLLIITLWIVASSALAAPPPEWANNGCVSCHTASPSLQFWSSTVSGGDCPKQPQLQGLDADNFVCRLNQQGGVMATLATKAGQAGIDDRAAILRYLIDLRDAKITNSLVLDPATIDSSTTSEGTVTITNERSLPLTYTVPTFSVSNGFSVIAQSCGTREVPAGNSCTLTIQFLPRSLPFTSETRSATMSLALAAKPSDNDPATPEDLDPGTRNVLLSAPARSPLEITTPVLQPFTATQPNTSAAQAVSIANRLSSNLRLCLVAETGSSFSAPSDFSFVGRSYDAGPQQCATVTTPGATPSQDIAFTPSAEGPRLARFTVQRVTVGGTLLEPLASIALQGNVGPFATVSGSGLTNNALFAGVRQDVSAGAAVPSVVTLTNSGNQTLRIASVTIPLVAGAASAEYTSSGCGVGSQLGQGASCDLSVSFDPAEAGARASQVRIAYSNVADTSASRRTAVIELQGQGTRGASLVVRDAVSNEVATGSAVAFGQQNIAVTYARRMTLSNVGTDETLAVSAPTLTPSASGFEFSAPGGAGSCAPLAAGITLPAGSSCFVDLRFAPTAVDNYSATLALPSRAAGASTALNNFVLNLSGDGVDGRPRLEWQTGAGGALSLLEVPGVTAVGSAAPPQVSLRLANSGPGAAALRVLNIIGSDASSFVIESANAGRCNFDNAAPPLLEGATCEVIIAFRPQTAGAKTGRLQIVSTGTTPAPLEVRAQASGPAATIALSATPDSMNLNEVRIGAQSAPAVLTLANDGTVSAVVTAIEASPGFAFERGSCAALPFSIQPRGSCTLTVRFAPGSTGAATGSLRVQVSGMAAPVEVALQGNGTEEADVSGGGCSISDGRSPTDPTLWTLVLLAALALLARHRRRARRGNGAP